MEYILYETKVKIKGSNKLGLIIDDEGRNSEGNKVLIVEYRPLDIENPIGYYLEEELELVEY